MKLEAAEQLFERPDGGVSSLLWIDHPLRPVILLVHDYGHWRGWPDTWDGQPLSADQAGVEAAGAERGFAHLVQRAGLGPVIGRAWQAEQSYRAEVEELKDDWDLSYGWELTDSRGRTLRLLVRPARWSVEKWPAKD